MYRKPQLERFGTLRELTLLGLGTDGDGGIQGWGRIVASVADACCTNRS